MAATREALRDAELEITPANRDEIGVFIASGIGGIATLSEQLEVLRSRGPGRISPFLIPAMITNLAAGQVSIVTGARGPSYCVTSACASSAHAIGEAAETIRRGWAKAMIVGGSEASITPIGVAGFNAMRALSTRNEDYAHASRPFDAEGLVAREEGRDRLWPLAIHGRTAELSVLSMGNPHAVQRVDDVDSADVASIGPEIEVLDCFPNKVNAGFMQVVSRSSIRLRVWERGAGETRACGTGACATAIAAMRHRFDCSAYTMLRSRAWACSR